MSFLSSRLSQFTKATKLFSTRNFRKTDLAKEFHDACDGKTNTLVIIKSGQYIAGGYTEVAWSSPAWTHVRAENAFLFSVNRQKVYGIVVLKHAMGVGQNYAAEFGETGEGLGVRPNVAEGGTSDLYGYDLDGVEDQKTELMGSRKFKVDEYEVYKLE